MKISVAVPTFALLSSVMFSLAPSVLGDHHVRRGAPKKDDFSPCLGKTENEWETYDDEDDSMVEIESLFRLPEDHDIEFSKEEKEHILKALQDSFNEMANDGKHPRMDTPPTLIHESHFLTTTTFDKDIDGNNDYYDDGDRRKLKSPRRFPLALKLTYQIPSRLFSEPPGARRSLSRSDWYISYYLAFERRLMAESFCRRLRETPTGNILFSDASECVMDIYGPESFGDYGDW